MFMIILLVYTKNTFKPPARVSAISPSNYEAQNSPFPPHFIKFVKLLAINGMCKVQESLVVSGWAVQAQNDGVHREQVCFLEKVH
jgi:hypothetical protein